MPQRIARRSKNWKFTDAAAAMGAFWERARKAEAVRIEGLRRALLERTESVVRAASGQQIARPTVN